MHYISIHAPNFSFFSELLPEIWGGSQNPRWRRGCAHAPAPPSGKKFNTVEAPNHIYSHTKFQLSNSITSWDMDRSPLFAIGLTVRGPQKWVFLGFSTRSGFSHVVWVSGYFLAKFDKIWVRRSICWYNFYANRFSGFGRIVTHTHIHTHGIGLSIRVTLNTKPASQVLTNKTNVCWDLA